MYSTVYALSGHSHKRTALLVAASTKPSLNYLQILYLHIPVTMTKPSLNYLQTLYLHIPISSQLQLQILFCVPEGVHLWEL